MKAGGTSLSWLLHCLCQQQSSLCRLSRDDGSLSQHGSDKCGLPSILCTHGHQRSAAELANLSNPTAVREWQDKEWVDKPKIFVLCEPVARVWSFYNFVANIFPPFRTHPIDVFLSRHVDPNELFDPSLLKNITGLRCNKSKKKGRENMA